MSSVEPLDRVTADIIANSVQAAADEMFAALRKTAMSPIIYEVLDAGTGITDAGGNITCSGAGIPGFIGVLDKAVKFALHKFGAKKDIHPGDVFISNDPYYGGVTHLNDAVIMMPVFVRDAIVAWTANIAHWSDIGGMIPGSLSPDATEIYQEGIRLPCVKLMQHGELDSTVYDIIRVNSRLSDFIAGDMWAGIASVRVGARRISQIVDKYGKGAYLEAIRQFMDYGEQTSLLGMRALPKGTFSIAERQDSGETYKVTITISDDAFVVDLRDNPPQAAGPSNTSADDAAVSAQMIFKNVTDPYGVSNAGTFRPLQVLTRPGTVFDAADPAAMGVYYEVGISLYDLLWRCLAPHVGDALPAGHFASICGTFISGRHPDTGRRFTIVEPELGGWGGSSDGDGNSAMFSAVHGETYTCPAEVAEVRYGVYVRRVELNCEDGGEGQYRGGKGVVVEYEARKGGCTLTAAYRRSTPGCEPWPVAGGLQGSRNRVEIHRANGTVESCSSTGGLPVAEGDVIRIITAAGAGYGDPKLRAPTAVEDDVRNEYLSPSRAEAIYGIAGGQ